MRAIYLIPVLYFPCLIFAKLFSRWKPQCVQQEKSCKNNWQKSICTYPVYICPRTALLLECHCIVQSTSNTQMSHPTFLWVTEKTAIVATQELPNFLITKAKPPFDALLLLLCDHSVHGFSIYTKIPPHKLFLPPKIPAAADNSTGLLVHTWFQCNSAR